MGIISRSSGAPYADGETLGGAELEADFNNLYSEFNGNIDSNNLADGAVTTSKLALTAVTQAKMTSGAASASEAQTEVGALGYLLNTSYATVGNPVTHNVGNPARHVMVTASWFLFAMTAGSTLNIDLLKDGTSMMPGLKDAYVGDASADTSRIMTRMWVDISPTQGGTHIYTLKMKLTAGVAAIRNLSMVVFEPRS